MNYIIITSINDVTEAVRKFANIKGWHVVVVGDKKSKAYEYENTTYLNIEDQLNLQFSSFSTTPYNHYSRKNLGYLYAISKGADLIYDTDDDTIPYDAWFVRDFKCNKNVEGSRCINPYSLFTTKKIWPRGLDLSYVNKPTNYTITNSESKIGVWQGVINGDSDFDAIYRLTVDQHVIFDIEEDVALNLNCYAPFNTQSTLWNASLYPLLYIPITVDFRFTDILRGYVAQRIMWDYGYKVGFHYPNTYQVRNAHDYFKDFLGELSMYKATPLVIDLLDNIKLENKTLGGDLLAIYQSLNSIGVVAEDELINLKNWLQDVGSLVK